ncbi:MAG TPA: BMP family ABC transporter substrate-binding protein [Conexibacter sp.]|nr:BMP family ABC transporter substrate-binding protein [Conexibacter sp.]
MKYPLSKWTTLRVVALALCGAALLAGCGSSGGGAGTAGGGTSTGGKTLRVGLVSSIGGINDRGFNQLSNLGMQEAQRQLGVRTRVLVSSTNADYVPNLVSLAQQHYDLVVGVGFDMADAVGTVAARFPQTKFAIVDTSQTAVPGRLRNVTGLVFKQEQAGYLAGYAAGLWAKAHGAKVVSSVGGMALPPVVAYIAGYRAGAQAADPGVQVLNGYSQDFADQAKCKEIALNQIAQGSKVVFAVAGGCGLGAVDAAGEQHVEAIGVDADQGYLGPQVLTSAVKKVDTAIVQAVQKLQGGTLRGGTDTVFDLRNHGVGLGRFAAGEARIEQAVAKIQRKLEAGGGASIPTR